MAIPAGVLKAPGPVPPVAARLKGYQPLSQPLTKYSAWTTGALQVRCQLILGLWLLSGLFAKAAWLAGILCFALFSLTTLYKGLTGAASCGCFGVVHVNPWVTLLAIDLPAVLALSLFRPAGVVAWFWAYVRRVLVPAGPNEGPRSLQSLILGFLSPLPSRLHTAATAGLVLAVLAVSTPLLALNKPAADGYLRSPRTGELDWQSAADPGIHRHWQATSIRHVVVAVLSSRLPRLPPGDPTVRTDGARLGWRRELPPHRPDRGPALRPEPSLLGLPLHRRPTWPDSLVLW